MLIALATRRSVDLGAPARLGFGVADISRDDMA